MKEDTTSALSVRFMTLEQNAHNWLILTHIACFRHLIFCNTLM